MAVVLDAVVEDVPMVDRAKVEAPAVPGIAIRRIAMIRGVAAPVVAVQAERTLSEVVQTVEGLVAVHPMVALIEVAAAVAGVAVAVVVKLA